MRSRVLHPHPGLSTGIGYYLSGMEEVRQQLVDTVKTIPDDLIGKPAFLGAHSIGALVLHIGEAEWFWMQMVVSGHKLTDEDKTAPCCPDLDRFASARQCPCGDRTPHSEGETGRRSGLPPAQPPPRSDR